jgi:hypothetical protein
VRKETRNGPAEEQRGMPFMVAPTGVVAHVKPLSPPPWNEKRI